MHPRDNSEGRKNNMTYNRGPDLEAPLSVLVLHS